MAWRLSVHVLCRCVIVVAVLLVRYETVVALVQEGILLKNSHELLLIVDDDVVARTTLSKMSST